MTGDSSKINLDITADHLRIAPAGEATVSVRVRIAPPVERFAVRLRLAGACAPATLADVHANLREVSPATAILTQLDDGALIEQAIAAVPQTTPDVVEAHLAVAIRAEMSVRDLTGRAMVVHGAGDDEGNFDGFEEERWIEATASIEPEVIAGVSIQPHAVRIKVDAHPRAMRHLPGIYHNQRFLARLLTAFEAVWTPLEQQIDHIDCYFDPRFVPSELLTWLAAWVGLDLDGQWPERRQRALIQNAIQLYRLRGTREGLALALNLFTGINPKDIDIQECFYETAAFGTGRVGDAALTGGDGPHTFRVTLRHAATDASNGTGADVPAAMPHVQQIARVIDIMKPIHTRCHLHLSAGGGA